MCPLPHNWWRWGGSLCTPQLARRGIYVPPTPQLGSLSVPLTTGRGGGGYVPSPPPTIGAPICAPHPTMGWSLSMLPTPQLARRGRSLFAPPHPSTGMGGWSLCRPPPQKKPKPQYGGGEGGPCFRYPNDLGKGAGGFPGNSKAPPPKSHAHTHPRAHPRTRRAPPPPQRWFWDGGGALRLLLVTVCPPPPHPHPPYGVGAAVGGGDTSSSSSSSSTPPQAFLGGGANLMISSSEGCRMMSLYFLALGMRVSLVSTSSSSEIFSTCVRY